MKVTSVNGNLVNNHKKLLLSAKTIFEHIKIRAGFLAWNSAILVTFVSCCKFQFK